MTEEKVPEIAEGKVGIAERLTEKFASILPWRKTNLYTGICIHPENYTAVLLSHTGAGVEIKNLATIPKEGSNYAISLRTAIRTLNKKWKLASSAVHVSLSSEQVTYKFFTLPGLSGKQIEQAIHTQLKSDKKWNPESHYLAFAPVKVIGNQTRVFASYAEQELVKLIMSDFSAIGANVYSIEPEIVSFHRALIFSKMVEDTTLALINATPTGGQLTIFTDAGVMLSRAIGGKREMISEEGEAKPEEEMNISAGESFDIDIAIDDMKKTFNYYEYSLIAGEVDAALLTGEPILIESLNHRVRDDLSIDTQNFVIDIAIQDEVASIFDPLTYATGLGAALGTVLGGTKWT